MRPTWLGRMAYRYAQAKGIGRDHFRYCTGADQYEWSIPTFQHSRRGGNHLARGDWLMQALTITTVDNETYYRVSKVEARNQYLRNENIYVSKGKPLNASDWKPDTFFNRKYLML